MTREEAINKLIRIRQQQGDKSEAHEALGMAIDALAYQAEFPEGLEAAADKYAHSLGYDEEKERLEITSAKEDFIAGAEWDRAKMTEKAVEGEIMTNGFYPYEPRVVAPFPNCPYNFGDKVKVIVIKEE